VLLAISPALALILLVQMAAYWLLANCKLFFNNAFSVDYIDLIGSMP
jgi:hypothetical protein